MRRSDTRLRGIGEQIIQIHIAELRDLAELPDEVEIVDVIPKPDANPFIPDPKHDGTTYIHIRSRYAMRRPAGTPLAIEGFDLFLQRWNDLWRQQR